MRAAESGAGTARSGSCPHVTRGDQELMPRSSELASAARVVGEAIVRVSPRSRATARKNAGPGNIGFCQGCAARFGRARGGLAGVLPAARRAVPYRPRTHPDARLGHGDAINRTTCRRIGAANDRRRREGIRKNGSLATIARTKPGPSAQHLSKLPATRFCTPSFVLAAPILRRVATQMVNRQHARGRLRLRRQPSPSARP